MPHFSRRYSHRGGTNYDHFASNDEAEMMMPPFLILPFGPSFVIRDLSFVSHHDSTVDAEYLTSDVPCLRRREECHRVGNFFRRGGPSKGDFSMNRLLDIFGKSGGHVRSHKPRRYCVHGDVAAR